MPPHIHVSLEIFKRALFYYASHFNHGKWHNRMSHNVINHTQGSTRSDHLWQIIKLGALKIDSCQFVKVLCHQPCERQFEGQKTFVFAKVATQTAERHQSLERPTSPTVNIKMSVLLCLCNMCWMCSVALRKLCQSHGMSSGLYCVKLGDYKTASSIFPAS